MARLAAVAVALAAIAAVAGAAESYYVSVENHQPERGMKLVCQAIGGMFVTELSVVPRGRVPHGKAGRRVAELVVEGARDGWVRCSWAYAGNYVAGLALFDSRWPESKKCQEPGRDGICRVVFEHDAVFLKTPDGGLRVLGDLPVKRCRRHWILFSTGCSYPESRTTRIPTPAGSSTTPSNTSPSDDCFLARCLGGVGCSWDTGVPTNLESQIL